MNEEELREQISDLSEINRLLTKSSRRCVRYMKHMLDEIKDKYTYNLYKERLDMWENIFWNTSDYRDELYSTINSLTYQLEQAKKLLKDNNLQELPF